MSNETVVEPKSLNKEQIKAYLVDIESRVINSDEAYMHSVIALNQLLRLPNAESVIDGELKEQMHDLWVKLKSHGVQLGDPPLLFGLPEDFRAEDEEIIIDDEPEIEIVSRREDAEEEIDEDDDDDDDDDMMKEGKLVS